MFYGWKIASLSSAGNFMLQGGVLYTMNAFMEPLCDLNGWSRALVSTSMGIAAFSGQVAMPLMAALSTRFSLRYLMVVGALTGGCATFCMGLTENIWLYTALFTVAWIATQACGGVVGNALVNNWFRRYRGRAFGIANTGTSLSGALLPLLALFLVNTFGVHVAYMTLGTLTLLLAPLSWCIVCDTPAERDLSPDGIPEPRKGHDATVNLNPLSSSLQSNLTDDAKTTETTVRAMQEPPQKSESLNSRRHILEATCIGIAFGFGLLCASGVMSQLKPRFADLGFSPWFAISLACLSALFAAFAKYLWGWLCDYATPLRAARIVMLASAASLLFNLLPSTLWSVSLFCILFGSCVGGLWTILPALVSSYFGNSHFLRCYKFVSIFIILRSFGFPLLGFSHDLTGSYLAADLICASLLLISFSLLCVLRENRSNEQTG